MTVTVLIGEVELLQECLRHILDTTNFRVIASAANFDELTLSATLKNHPILFIVDAWHEPDGAIAQIDFFKAEYPAARIVALAHSDRPADIVSLFRAGANACFQNGTTSSTLLKSLEIVMLGETLLPPGLLTWMLKGDQAPPSAPAVGDCLPRLSAREESILGYLMEGYSNKVIANRLGIALATANVHVKAVVRKVGAQNRTQAAIWARKNAPSDYAARSSGS
jgi:DNA-binding NarL/FixJ family response regulator